MNLQHERIAALCEELRLSAVAENYPPLAQAAVDDQKSFADFLESVLSAEKAVGSSRVDLQACKLEYSIVSPK